MGADVDLPDTELARIRGAFAPKTFETLPAVSEAFEAAKASTPAFARFARNNLKPHKAPGYSIVEVSLKAIGDTPGDATSEQMEVVPTSPSATARATSASPTSRTWSCRTSGWTMFRRSGRPWPRPGSPPQT